MTRKRSVSGAAAAAAAFTQGRAMAGQRFSAAALGRANTCGASSRGAAGVVQLPGHRRGRPVQVEAIDAAQPFDFEAKAKAGLEKKRRQEKKLKIGIVGFGNFGQFLAKRFIANGHELIATSRGDYHDVAAELGVGYFRDPDDFCEMHPDVVIFWRGVLPKTRNNK